ncbi:endoribonuclease Arlr isoform X1 [Leptinotarsa decemlineata]|uniref:endoribonuclease Arlr isoform X1 n=1 Tax=Leptinotarsa decemlineata TaxID=7539 RepID=UPI000C255646|nr:poly(U)-specific endoribonuclease homolog isoform X1 [Leptinotarsa decemlineata]
MNLSSFLIHFVIFMISALFGDVLCGDITGQISQNPWHARNNHGPIIEPYLGTNSKSTTPWPSLGRHTNRQNVFPTNTTKAPMWVRPNNGPNWVRNTPVPPQGTSNRDLLGVVSTKPMNTNTVFINNERGGTAGGVIISSIPSVPNTPSHNRNTMPVRSSDSMPLRGQNNNNRAGGVISSGSMVKGAMNNAERQNGGETNPTEVTDNELREFAEELLNKDINNAAVHVTLNLQGMTTSRSTVDQAPLPLLSINQAAYSIPSISKMMLLYNNYILKANENEVYTAQEKAEENDLLDTILSTPVMQHARNFLIKKGKLGRDPKEFKDLLRLIWFNMYSRGGGRIGSSGFEHVFLAEIKNSQVSGLHNWIYFHEEERKNNANYLGYMKKLDLGNKGAIVKYHFNFHNIDKPVGSMFVGTSPELEMAIYSTCFVLRADRICPLKMNGNRFVVRTYTYRYRGKNMIGSAFPEV